MVCLSYDAVVKLTLTFGGYLTKFTSTMESSQFASTSPADHPYRLEAIPEVESPLKPPRGPLMARFRTWWQSIGGWRVAIVAHLYAVLLSFTVYLADRLNKGFLVFVALMVLLSGAITCTKMIADQVD